MFPQKLRAPEVSCAVWFGASQGAPQCIHHPDHVLVLFSHPVLSLLVCRHQHPSAGSSKPRISRLLLLDSTSAKPVSPPFPPQPSNLSASCFRLRLLLGFERDGKEVGSSPFMSESNDCFHRLSTLTEWKRTCYRRAPSTERRTH